MVSSSLCIMCMSCCFEDADEDRINAVAIWQTCCHNVSIVLNVLIIEGSDDGLTCSHILGTKSIWWYIPDDVPGLSEGKY